MDVFFLLFSLQLRLSDGNIKRKKKKKKKTISLGWVCVQGSSRPCPRRPFVSTWATTAVNATCLLLLLPLFDCYGHDDVKTIGGHAPSHASCGGGAGRSNKCALVSSFSCCGERMFL